MLTRWRKLLYLGVFSLLLGFGLKVLLSAPLQAASLSQATPPKPFTIHSIGVDGYPTIVVTLSEVTSPAISSALLGRMFTVRDTGIEKGIDNYIEPVTYTNARAVDSVDPTYLYLVLDKSFLVDELPNWGIVTQSVANLIRALGPHDPITILPFSAQPSLPLTWTTSQEEALAYLNTIQTDSTETALNIALEQALQVSAKLSSPGNKRIVVITNRLDNTVKTKAMIYQFKSRMDDSKRASIPINLIYYGPVSPILSIADLEFELKVGGGSFRMLAAPDELNTTLQQLYALFNRVPMTYSFSYITNQKLDGEHHDLRVSIEQLGTEVSSGFNLPPQRVEPITLMLQYGDPANSKQITEHTTLKWNEASNLHLYTDVGEKAFIEQPVVTYRIGISAEMPISGPYSLDTLIPLNVEIPTDRSLSEPSKPLSVEINAIVTGRYLSQSSKKGWLEILPPPAFENCVTVDDIAGGCDALDFREEQLITLALTNSFGLSPSDRVKVECENISGHGGTCNSFISELAINNSSSIILPSLSPPLTATFLADFWQMMELSWNAFKDSTAQVQKRQPIYVIKMSLVEHPKIQRTRHFRLTQLTLGEIWGRFYNNHIAWFIPILVIAIVFWLLYWVIRYLRQMNDILIPITIQNRNSFPAPCYIRIEPSLIGKSAAVSTEILAKKSRQSLHFYIRPSDAQPIALLDNGRQRIAYSPSSSRTAAWSQWMVRTFHFRQNSTERLSRSIRAINAWVRSPYLWLRRDLNWWAKRRIFRAATATLGTGASNIGYSSIGYSSATPAVSPTTATSGSSLVPVALEQRLVPGQWIKLGNISNDKAFEGLVRIESSLRLIRDCVHVTLYTSPYPHTEICEYQLEIGVGSFWRKRPFSVIAPGQYK